MKIIIFGAPGSGKGTQSFLLIKKKSFCKISPGELLRLELFNKGNLSSKITTFIKNGKLIDDDIIFSLISRYLNSENILFDGYPRNLNQALYLDDNNVKIDLIINITVSFSHIFKRMKYRMVSEKTYSVLDLLNNNVDCIRYKDNDTGFNFLKRIDDKYTIIDKRLNDYNIEIVNILSYYSRSGVFILNVDGNHDINSVYMFIEKNISEFYKKNE